MECSHRVDLLIQLIVVQDASCMQARCRNGSDRCCLVEVAAVIRPIGDRRCMSELWRGDDMTKDRCLD